MTLKQGKYDVVPTDLMSPTCSISYASSNTAWRKQRSLCLSAALPLKSLGILGFKYFCNYSKYYLHRICTIKQKTLGMKQCLVPKFKQLGAGGTGQGLGLMGFMAIL